MKHSFTDLHHHLLWGVDDGPQTESQAAAMLRRSAADGATRIIATPHVVPGVKPCSMDQLAALTARANELCARLELNLQVDLGSEILYTSQTARFLSEGRVPTLAGTDRVLVEFSPDVTPSQLQHAIDQILNEGFLPVLAHMERYRCLSGSFRFAARLRRSCDVFYQVNARSVLEGGFFQRRFVQRLLKEGLVDAVASDAHNTASRPTRMKDAWRALYADHGADYAHYLTSGALLLDER